MPATARKGQEHRSRPRGGGRRREPADGMVEAGGVDSARWVVCTLWRLCSHSDCCSSWERMVQAAFPLLDLGLAAMHAWIASWSWLNLVFPALLTIDSYLICAAAGCSNCSEVPYMSYYSGEDSTSRWDYVEVKEVQELHGVYYFHHQAEAVASPLITLVVFPEDPQRKTHLKNLRHLLHRTYSHGLWSVAQTLSTSRLHLLAPCIHCSVQSDRSGDTATLRTYAAPCCHIWSASKLSVIIDRNSNVLMHRFSRLGNLDAF
ncbi:uncharacterized protein LOC124703871 [Lolium rigidum]|uniref:uncharacterized protein LOC124703871 n=1 Tax=Lolium rigidum TaxID=89674 RepID=UPI001F5D1F88|nr:uncharacterized protein LOC124703871 [Lolium rigidum]